MGTLEEEARGWYRGYDGKKGRDRNDLLTNPEVQFQHFAFEDSFVSAFRRATYLSRETSKILDVGCGSGGSLATLLQLGFSPENLHGIDLLEERVRAGLGRYANVHFVCGDAAFMPYESSTFDLVMESTMFVQLTDQPMSERVADEMIRVVKAGGAC